MLQSRDTNITIQFTNTLHLFTNFLKYSLVTLHERGGRRDKPMTYNSSHILESRHYPAFSLRYILSPCLISSHPTAVPFLPLVHPKTSNLKGTRECHLFIIKLMHHIGKVTLQVYILISLLLLVFQY